MFVVVDEKSPRLRELKKKFEEAKARRNTSTTAAAPRKTANSESGSATAAVKPKQAPAVTMRKAASKGTSRPASDDSVSKVSSCPARFELVSLSS